MANPVKHWELEDLARMGLLDTTPRAIKGSDRVSVVCSCGENGQILFSTLVIRCRHGARWVCRNCLKTANSERGRRLTGKQNPFFGKSHSNETKERMRVKSRERWDKTPKEDRIEIGHAIRDIAYEKYNGNPMANPEVRSKYDLALKEFYNDPESLKQSKDKRKTTNLLKYGREHFIQGYELGFTSKGETEIKEFIEELGFKCTKRRLGGVEIDIFISELNLGIEFKWMLLAQRNIQGQKSSSQ